MKAPRSCASILATLALIGTGLVACQTVKHTMLEPRPGTNVVCQQCYDEVAKVRRRAGRRGLARLLRRPGHIRRYWPVIQASESKDPALGFLTLFEKSRRGHRGDGAEEHGR